MTYYSKVWPLPCNSSHNWRPIRYKMLIGLVVPKLGSSRHPEAKREERPEGMGSRPFIRLVTGENRGR